MTAIIKSNNKYDLSKLNYIITAYKYIRQHNVLRFKFSCSYFNICGVSKVLAKLTVMQFYVQYK